MANLRLTDIGQSTGVTTDNLIHVVNTGDTTQYSGGSSYKASISQVFDSLSGYTAQTINVNNLNLLNVGTNPSVSNLGVDVNGNVVYGNDVFTTGFTINDNTFTISDNSGNTFTQILNTLTGLTVNGSISATTYENLPVSGATSVGNGEPIYKTINNGVIEIKSITGTSNNKISATTVSDTIQLDINEQNLTLWNLVVQGNKLLDGSVVWISGLTFQVTDLSYIIGGIIYSAASTTITLQSGDTTYDRIDVIYADTGSTVGVLSGTPSNNPEKPIIDGNTQVEVTFVSVPVNATGASINDFIIYDENTGTGGGEWNFLAYGGQSSKFNPNFTGVTYSGSKSIRVTGFTGTANSGFYLSASTPIDITQYSSLQFALRNINALGTNSRLYIYLVGAGGVITSTYTQVLWNGTSSFPNYINYSPTNTSTWQLISIPLYRFYATNNSVYGIIVRPYNITLTQSVNQYLDKFQFVGGVPVNPPTNAWFGIRGDSSTPTITPLTPNYTLIISGGTNIASVVTSPNRVNLNLDNNISLSGVTTGTLKVTSGATNGYVLTSDASGNATWQPSSGGGGGTFTGGTVTGNTNFTGGLSAITFSAVTIGSSGDCVDDLYVSNIHSCSPLYINPLSEGNVYVGSANTLTVDLTNERVGIGTSTPTKKIHISGETIIDSTINGSVPLTIKTPVGGGYSGHIDWQDNGGSTRFTTGIDGNDRFLINGTGSYSTRFQPNGQMIVSDNGSIYAFGNNSLNVMNTNQTGNNSNMFIGGFGGTINTGGSLAIGGESAPGTTTPFVILSGRKENSTSVGPSSYQGYFTIDVASGTSVTERFRITSDGNVGIGTENPSEKLEVSGRTKTTNFTMTSGATNDYLLKSDSSGNASWSPLSGITGVVNKYTITTGFTASVTKTITHNLNTKYVHCSVWDQSNDQLITVQVVRTLGNINNAVDITIATTGTYDILITG